MLYSCEVWTDLTQTFVEGMEKSYKAMLYTLLEVPKGTYYATVLVEGVVGVSEQGGWDADEG